MIYSLIYLEVSATSGFNIYSHINLLYEIKATDLPLALDHYKNTIN